MSRIRSHVNPALILSMVAIFIALGGGAYAALSANSVGSKQLKKNAVTAKKIKKNAVTSAKLAGGAVTTAKIKNDAVNGSKVLESSLSQVPSAALAASATTADNATSAESLKGYQRIGFKRLTPSFSDPSFPAALAGATEVPLFDLGQASIYGKCFKSGASLYGGFYIKTTANGTVFDSYYDNLYGYPYLNVGTPETDREVLFNSVGPNSATYSTGADPTLVLTPDGKSYQTTNALFLKQGDIPSGDGPYGAGDACILIGEGGES